MDTQGKWSSEHTFTAAKSSVKVDMRGFERGNKGYKEALIKLKSAIDEVMDIMKHQPAYQNILEMMYFQKAETYNYTKIKEQVRREPHTHMLLSLLAPTYILN